MAEIPTKTGTISTRAMPNRRDVDGELRDRLGVGRGSPGIDKPSKWAKVIEVVKTLLWVVPLTILIWVYAEREQLQKDQEIAKVPIKLKSTASDRMVMLNNPQETVTLVLNGPQAGINKVRDALTTESGSALQVEISDDLRLPFDGEILLAERLARNSLFTNEAVTVVQTKPAAVKIKAERKVTIPAKVQIRPDDRVGITDVKFTPEEISLDVPESLVVGPTTRPDVLPVYADLKSLIDKGQGTHSGKVPVVFAPEQSTWTIPPQTVTATVTIKASKSLKLPSIPIWARLQTHVLENPELHFSFDPLVARDVEVTGPAKAIDELDKRIQNRTFTPLAFIDLEPDDLSKLVDYNGQFVKKLGSNNYEMPADLAKDLKVTSPTSEILVTVTKR
ncbi:MAG: hypothetical protein ACM359_19115 [Bacillota bacterium]